jgi:PmbA protein
MAEAADTQTLLEDLLRAARKAGADAADAMVVDGASIAVACRMGALETLERSEGGDIGLRVFCGRRSAIVSSADRRKPALDDLVARAVAMARSVPEDPYGGLADPDQLATAAPAIDLCDGTDRSAEDLIAAAQATEDAARAVAGVTNSEGAEAAWSRMQVVVAGTNGFNHAYSKSSSSISVSVLAGATGEGGMERDWDYSSAVYWDDLRAAAEVGRSAGERAVRRLGARRVKSARVPVVFDQRMARGLLGHFLGAINGAAVARGMTFLKDAMDSEVFAPGITIVEDPHRPRGARSRPVDAEGLPTVRRALIDGGRLTSWILDLRSARQLALPPTGHAVRGTASAPSGSPSNVWMEAGPLSPQALIGEIDQGLYVTDLFGQGINGVTGDYSRGCAGFWIENGRIAFPVNEMTVAGNLRDMFRTVTPANDLEMIHGTDAPTLRVDGLTVAGGG